MNETDEMKEIFEELPWVREEFELEQEIIEQQVMTGFEYEKVLKEIEWIENLD